MVGEQFPVARVADALGGADRFAAAWLADGDKLVVPVVALSGMDRSLAARCAAGARSLPVDFFWMCPLDRPNLPAHQVRAVADDLELEASKPPVLFLLPDGSGAVWVTSQGYALAAGRGEFLGGFCDQGVDGDRARFGRDAARLARRHPALPVIARNYPPRTHPRSVTPDTGSAVGEQLELMRALDRGEIAAPDFTARFLAARRRALEAGERTRDPLDRALRTVFYAIDDYVAEPELRDDGDLDEAGLADAVRGALDGL